MITFIGLCLCVFAKRIGYIETYDDTYPLIVFTSFVDIVYVFGVLMSVGPTITKVIKSLLL